MTREELVDEARSWIGTPFQHRASVKGAGVDCLGLVAALHRACKPDTAVTIPAYAPDWPLDAGGEILIEGLRGYLAPIAKTDRAAGDVLAFRWRQHLPVMHLGVLSGNETLIHVHQHAEVCEVPLTPWWHRHCAAAFSFFS
jgi:NlpC/P60 family putative phage cell wall peptidase